MLDFNQFFQACSGFWQIERTYHDLVAGEIDRSHTEYRVNSLTVSEKQALLSLSPLGTLVDELKNYFPEQSLDTHLDGAAGTIHQLGCPGFGISFDTISEKGEQVSMHLKALFIPYQFVKNYEVFMPSENFPIAAELPKTEEAIQGFYLRDEGYSESGLIQSSFTYLPSRQTLEMTTFYRRSIAVDQMRFVAPGLRLRTIITYEKPPAGEVPEVITLVGFGVEKRQPA
ncbi:MAG: phycobiliprotein lyase [Coleofasciculaceae cyanobacterium SM2_1_6]|nr:phycobiliprotein lyase [Coleofasciculaceae cyanobacterium SM2_1_6]